MKASMGRAAIVLGLLAAVGPFAIDMYLPAMPTIAADLGASQAATQATLTSFFAAFGASQLLYGPAADSFGRKPPLYFGLSLFLVGSLICAAAPSIAVLIGARALQGLGAAAVMVVPRAIIRDLYTGVEATRLMALVMLVISISPMLAPSIGGALIAALHWRAVFAAVLLAALLAFLLSAFVLGETWPKERRGPFAPLAVGRAYVSLFRDLRFLGLTFIGASGMASFFTFLASSSFLYIGHYGLTPNQYGLAFAANAIGFFAASQFAAPLSERFGVEPIVKSATSAFAAFALAMFLTFQAGVDSLAALMPMLALTFACLGLVIPTTMVLALDEQGERAGLASALGGALQMGAGALCILLVGLLPKGDARSMTSVIALMAIFGLILTRLILRGQRAAKTAPSAAE